MLKVSLNPCGSAVKKRVFSVKNNDQTKGKKHLHLRRRFCPSPRFDDREEWQIHRNSFSFHFSFHIFISFYSQNTI